MDVVGKETRFATGRCEADGGAGDSSVLTAYGVFQGMRASAEHLWGSADAGRPHGRDRRRRQGGTPAAAHLIEDGADVVVTDVDEPAVDGACAATYPQVGRGTGRRGARPGDLDVYAPCALGGALDGSTVESLSAAIVCGAANNQLAHEVSTGPPPGCPSGASSTPPTSSSTPAG